VTRPCCRRNRVKVLPVENSKLSWPSAPHRERPDGGRVRCGLLELGEHTGDGVHRPRRSPGAVSESTARPRKHAAGHCSALYRRQRLHARSGEDRQRPVGDQTRQRRKAHTHETRISEPTANGYPSKGGGHGDIDRRHRVAAADVSEHVTQCGERRVAESRDHHYRPHVLIRSLTPISLPGTASNSTGNTFGRAATKKYLNGE
jgi:hypothetical protein